MLAKILLTAFALTASAQATEHNSTDGAFSLRLSGGQLGRTQGETVFAWGVGRSVRVSVNHFSETLSDQALFQRTTEDARRLQQKGRRVDSPQLLKLSVPFSLTGFGTTSFGYFNANTNTYSFLVKGLSRQQAAEVLGTLRELRTAPPPMQEPEPTPQPKPAYTPAPVESTELPPADGIIPLLNGQLEMPKPRGWKIVAQNDGWTLLEGADWSFALSSRVIEDIPADQKGSIQETAAAYFARFELDFVERRGCQASPIDGGELANDWKMLFKTYQCPGMSGERRQVVGILLPSDLPMLGWTGDYDRSASLPLFEKWLSAGQLADSSKEPSTASGSNKKLLIISAIGTALGISLMTLFLISRRRKQAIQSE